MNKTFEITEAYIGKRVLDIIVNDYNVDGACKVLEALGYQLLYREY